MNRQRELHWFVRKGQEGNAEEPHCFAKRPVSLRVSGSSSVLSSSTKIPHSIAQVNAIYGQYTPAMVEPMPGRPLTKEQALEMLEVSTQVRTRDIERDMSLFTVVSHQQVAECFVGSHPLFPASGNDAEIGPARWAVQLLALDQQVCNCIRLIRDVNSHLFALLQIRTRIKGLSSGRT
jgi:hypothetical protein